MSKPIYLDYAATTPVDPRVADAMVECLTRDGIFANPASRSHVYGWQAEERVEIARAEVAGLLNCDPREIVWTSGATEANNLALKGIFEKLDFSGHLVTSAIEHKAILDTAKWLEGRGVAVTYLMPDSDGIIAADKVAAAMTPETKLVSLMYVNNEVGSVNPVRDIATICAQRSVLLHVDAAQAAGKQLLDVGVLGVDLLSLSAHKFYGPKGVGALYVKRAIQRDVAPQMHGGGHERGMRSGTLATHQLVGMGKAAMLCEHWQSEAQRLSLLRDRLWHGIEDLPSIARNGSQVEVGPAHLNVCFGGIEGENLMLSLRQLAVSSGSACTSASMAPSYVLKAMGVQDESALSSIRISLGRYTTAEDIDQTIQHIRQTVLQLQEAS
ncbi:aminotransferase class V-fold PLP-dependent enzyme [Aurantivibrio plasticivorans]